MATRIRLARFGAKKNPFYRIVVSDIEAPRDGRFIEQIGTYDPKKEKDAEKVEIKEDRLKYWISKGATPSGTVGDFLKKMGLLGDSE
jgi:small subunit ribosomal protein S16